MLEQVGLGNTRILTDFAQKSPQTLLLYICRMGLVMPAHLPTFEVKRRSLSDKIELTRYTKQTYTFGGGGSKAVFRRCYGVECLQKFKNSSSHCSCFYHLEDLQQGNKIYIS